MSNTATQEATAQVFLTAFRSLSKREQEIFIHELMKDNRMREDLMDFALAEKRSKEKSRGFREFLKESK